MKDSQKRAAYKIFVYSALFATLIAVLYLASRVTAPDLVPVVAFGAGFLTAGAASWAFLRKRDFPYLIEALDRAAIGDFSIRLGGSEGVPEGLAEAFNRMARRSGRRFKAMEDQLQAAEMERRELEGCRERCSGLEKKVAVFEGQHRGADSTARDAEKRMLTDPLTGLYNKRQMEQTLLRELKGSERFKRRMSIMLADLDSFEGYINNNGEEAGERLLKGVASTFRNVMRNVDAIARLRGDQFVVLLPETSSEDAHTAAERARLAVMATCPATVSIGIATFPDDARDLEGLFEKAHEALKTSKREGRNRTTVSGPYPGPPAWARAA